MVTLRGDRMYEFLDRLVNVALPRVRDFRGVSPKAFDGRGNYTLGIKDQLIFPEIDYNKVDKTKGMNITHHDHGQDRCRRSGAAEAHGDAVPAVAAVTEQIRKYEWQQPRRSRETKNWQIAKTKRRRSSASVTATAASVRTAARLSSASSRCAASVSASSRSPGRSPA